TLSAFGRLTADMEILAIKTSGVNPLRLLVPLLVAAGALTGLMIEFNDKTLPKLNHKARLLMGDVRAMRPTLVFRPGLFVDDIRGYLILLDKVNHVTSEVEGVRINDIRNPERPVMIIAERGLMEFVDRGNTIKFTLYDGQVHEMNLDDPHDYRKVDFGRQVFFVTNVGSELKRSESEHKTDREMNIAEMEAYLEKVERAAEPYRSRVRTLVDAEITELLTALDSGAVVDSVLVVGSGAYIDKYTGLTPRERDSTRLTELQANIGAINRQIERSAQQIDQQKNIMNKYNLEIQKKYSIPFACIAFVLFGAPLGILARRSGMGFSIAISLVLFVIYWAFLIGGESLADRGLADPFWAMWGANFLIGGIGLYLLYLVHAEKPVFSFLRRG
ncbi:MAG TPA: LptF/LptG family permease, partial [candidate division Zixibacteria bacterium]|nr:LptF/LptG family permease [candidate division Zixibacteria bacterium]